MNVRIHRGAHEVGGTCIEVESAGARIVLDVGQPLDADPAIVTRFRMSLDSSRPIRRSWAF